MRRYKLRILLAVGAASILGIGLALPASAGTAAAPPAQTSAQGTVIPSAVGAGSQVLVMLRDLEAGLPARSSARRAALQSEEAPLAASLVAAHATVETTGSALPYVVASVTPAQRAALAADPLVQAVEPDVVIPSPTSDVPNGGLAVPQATPQSGAAQADPSICGTAAAPEVDPEAVNVINAPAAWAAGYDGTGVSVAYIAGSIDPTIADFQRNAKYASAGSAAGSPILTPVNFTGDPSSAPGGGAAGESFLDASSIAAQGNSVFNLDNYISASHTLPSPCDITITGAAPGASIVGLDVFSSEYDTTESNFIQAIDFAVTDGVKVINESFGANNFPDTALDVTRIADDDAVAAGVTVVVSSGDAGVGNTIGSPATDPNLISAGASTTFRSYEQDFYGGINATTPKSNDGTWIDNNVSSLSSSGFSMSGGNTVDLLAPGDLNWILCSTSSQFAAGCTDENGNPSPINLSGGTSESAPLTSAAAADVIQAYAATHGGADPAPALVKQILMSTATDVDAPAEQQGAGLLDVGAAVDEAVSLPGTSATAQGGLLVSPNQVNIDQTPGHSTSEAITVTNSGSSSVTVNLSTRALTKQVASTTSSFCLNPSSSAIAGCGPPTANTFQIWSGITEVYQEETFSVPATTGPSRLELSADYPADSPPQNSVLHVALLEPSGAYAGFSLPQGFADYGHVEVADPAAGTWTAVFFTEQDGATSGGVGTTGNIQWQATTWEYQPAGTISPSSLTIAAGSTATATFTATSPAASGDTAQAIVLSTVGGPTNTIPVTVRTLVHVTANGGNFSGVLTGGNGRTNPSDMDTYAFTVPKDQRDLDVSVSFADVNDVLVAYLLDPEGEAVAQSSNLTVNSSGSALLPTGAVNVYKDAPEGGQWWVVLDWLEPVSGSELAEPFNGAIRFNQVSVNADLPHSSHAGLVHGKSYTFHVTVRNTGLSPEAFFIDPRTSTTAPVRLPDLFGSDQNMSLPLLPGLTFPLYFVPTDTTGIVASLTGSQPVTFDVEPFPGDPDLSPAVPAPGVTESQSGDVASLTYTSPSGEVMTGLWSLNPSEIGPYGSSGASAATASASFSAVTPTFDPNVASPTGDLWQLTPFGSGFAPVYVEPGETATIPVTINVTAPAGSSVSGSINLDDTFLANFAVGLSDSGGDELASIHYGFTVISS